MSTRMISSSERVQAMLGRLTGAAAACGASMGAAGLVRDIVEAGLASQRLENTLRAATGSVQSAGEAYAFMRQEANRLEPDLQTAAT
jgi:hypothetical protein